MVDIRFKRLSEANRSFDLLSIVVGFFGIERRETSYAPGERLIHHSPGSVGFS